MPLASLQFSYVHVQIEGDQKLKRMSVPINPCFLFFLTKERKAPAVQFFLFTDLGSENHELDNLLERELR
jgi:hypothetical protein